MLGLFLQHFSVSVFRCFSLIYCYCLYLLESKFAKPSCLRLKTRRRIGQPIRGDPENLCSPDFGRSTL